MTAADDRRPRTDRGRRTRDTLLTAARRVFERQGFAATRMSDVAAEAGVSHGTVYTYFDTKEDLLAGTIESLIDELQDSIRGVDLSDPVERIARANAGYLRSFGRNARLLGVVEEVASTDSRFSAILDELRRSHVQRVAHQIRRQQSLGAADADLDPHLAAAALCAMVEGFSRHWSGLGSPQDPDGRVTLTLLWQRALGLPAPEPREEQLEESDGVHV